MKTINWIQVGPKLYGGNAYRDEAQKVLQKSYDLNVKNVEAKFLKWRYLKPAEWAIRSVNLEGEADLWIQDEPFCLIFWPFERRRGKNLFMVHHLDFSVFPSFLKPGLALLERIFYRAIKKADGIVTVSNFWRDYFLSKGYDKVFRIYNAFNVSDYDFQEEEIEEFKRKYNLGGKPIVYLGNCQKSKGVIENYEALKGLDVYLVSSGRKMVDFPGLNLNLERRDYLKLLKAASVVLTMSLFKEGWCRTAHEAMLLKTPIIGSGQGGMKELLEGGKQMICTDFGSLRQKVEYLLDHPEVRNEMGEQGHNFAKNFTLDKFEKDWLDLIKAL